MEYTTKKEYYNIINDIQLYFFYTTQILNHLKAYDNIFTIIQDIDQNNFKITVQNFMESLQRISPLLGAFTQSVKNYPVNDSIETFLETKTFLQRSFKTLLRKVKNQTMNIKSMIASIKERLFRERNPVIYDNVTYDDVNNSIDLFSNELDILFDSVPDDHVVAPFV